MNQYGHHVLTTEFLDEFHIGKANRENARAHVTPDYTVALGPGGMHELAAEQGNDERMQ